MSETKGKHTPRCPKCGSFVQFELLYPEAKGIVATCAKGCRFPLMDGLADCAQFFPHEQLVAALRDALAISKSWETQKSIVCAALQSKGIPSPGFASWDVKFERIRAALRAAGEDVE